MKIEIVSHCWYYTAQLTYQLSSLVLNPPRSIEVKMTVCYSQEDLPTTDLLTHFASIVADNVSWNWVEMPKDSLFRRSIGRNLAAIQTSADWIWFADADMCFGDRCLDSLACQLRRLSDPLVYPKCIWISESHDVGDATLDRVKEPGVFDFDPEEFVRHFYDRAIGGVQIVNGVVARHSGYNRSQRKWLQPTQRLDDFRDDVAFRRSLGTRGRPIDAVNLFRIRHARHGRRDEHGQLIQSTEGIDHRGPSVSEEKVDGKV